MKTAVLGVALALAQLVLGKEDVDVKCELSVIPKSGEVENYPVECLLAQFGGKSTVGGNVVFAEPRDGCKIDGTVVDISKIIGNILLVDRGACSFAKKAAAAQEVGAAAVIV